MAQSRETLRSGERLCAAGEIINDIYLPTPGGLQDPSAEIFASWAGGKVLGAVLGNILGRISSAFSKETTVASEVAAGETAATSPNFVVTPGGTSIPVPNGATGPVMYQTCWY